MARRKTIKKRGWQFKKLPDKDKVISSSERYKSVPSMIKIRNMLKTNTEILRNLSKEHCEVADARDALTEFLRKKRIESRESFVNKTRSYQLEVFHKFLNKKFKKKIVIDPDSFAKLPAMLSDAKTEIRAEIQALKKEALSKPTVTSGTFFNEETGRDERVADAAYSIEEYVYTAPFDNNVQYKYKYVAFADSKQTHLEKGDILAIQNIKRLQKLFEPKKPKADDKKNYLGIELEFISKANRTEMAKALASVNLFNYVHLKDDGSVHPDKEYPYGHEICILVAEDELEVVVNKVVYVLNKMESKVNKTCGTHVHLDMRNRNSKTCFYNLTSIQDLLYSMNSKYRLTGNERGRVYCKKVETKDFDEAMKTMKDHYNGINLTTIRTFNTIEIRIHSGTINEEKLVNWCKILMAVINTKGKLKEDITTVDAFESNYEINDKSLISYMNERVMKFNDPKKGHLIVDEAS